MEVLTVNTLTVFEKIVDNSKFRFVKLGDRGHGVPEVIIWLSKEVAIDKNEEGEDTLDISKVSLRKTPKGGWIFIPAPPEEKAVVFGVECGYRGNSHIHVPEGDGIGLKFHHLSSPRGNLGISEFVLLNIKKGEKLKLKFENSGRNVTVREGEIIITWDDIAVIPDDFPFEVV